MPIQNTEKNLLSDFSNRKNCSGSSQLSKRALMYTHSDILLNLFVQRNLSVKIIVSQSQSKDFPEYVRAYDIRFCRQDIKGKSLINFVTLGIVVTCRSKFGDNDENEQMIELVGLNCYKRDFDYFFKAADEVLKLEPYFPRGTDAYDALLSGFLASDFLSDDAKALISGAIQTRQYELAVKALAGQIESNIREKLLFQNEASATSKAGTELAKLAFSKESGKLVPPWNVATESQQGIHLIFNGFFLWIRNGFHHHTHIFEADKDGILELLQLCNALLKIIEKCTPK